MNTENTPFLHKFVAFRCIINSFSPNVFKYLSEKLPLSQKICYFRGSHFSHCFYQLSIAHYKISFCANNYFEKLLVVITDLGIRQFQSLILFNFRWKVINLTWLGSCKKPLHLMTNKLGWRKLSFITRNFLLYFRETDPWVKPITPGSLFQLLIL